LARTAARIGGSGRVIARRPDTTRAEGQS